MDTPVTSSLIYEEHFVLPKKTLNLLLLGSVLLAFLWWKLLVPEAALTAIALTLGAAGLVYYAREARIAVTRGEILLEGAFKTVPISLKNITKLTIIEKRNGSYYPLGTTTPLTIRGLTLPLSTPTYLFAPRGVLLERINSQLPLVFLPSTNAERLVKAIEDAKRW